MDLGGDENISEDFYTYISVLYIYAIENPEDRFYNLTIRNKFFKIN